MFSQITGATNQAYAKNTANVFRRSLNLEATVCLARLLACCVKADTAAGTPAEPTRLPALAGMDKMNEKSTPPEPLPNGRIRPAQRGFVLNAPLSSVICR
jgi:hypothetical protein